MENKASTSNITLLIIYINIILYSTCYQIQRPLEPYLVSKLNLDQGDSADEYAKLQSFFSVMQTFGSLISGWLLDRFGVKGGFALSFLASALSYGLLSQSTSLNILYLSKVPAIFQAGFLCGQVAASQATSDGADRVQALGRLTMSYTIGSIIGPTVGGFLGANGDYYFGAKLAVAGSILSIFLTFLMPNDKVNSKGLLNEGKINNENKNEENNVPVTIFGVFRVVWLYLMAKVITSVANSMSASVMPIVLKDTYMFDEKNMGFIMSIMSAFNSVVNGALLSPIVNWTGGNLGYLIEMCLLLMCILFAIQSATSHSSISGLYHDNGLYSYIGCSFALTIFQYVLATTITSESTSKVASNARGTLLGMEHSLFAAARVFAPAAGVTMWKSGGVTAVSGACSAVFATVLIGWNIFYEKTKNVDVAVAGERKEK
eukprot:gene7089-9674_t